MAAPCPKCRGTLQLTFSGGAPVGVCQSCRGIWLSVSSLIYQTSSEVYRDLRAAPRQGAAPHPFREGPPVACLACQQPLQLKQLGPVEVEHCPGCDAVFLDSGELVALVLAFREHRVRYRRSGVAEHFADALEALAKTFQQGS